MPFYTVQDPIITQGTGRRITRDTTGRLWVVYDDQRLPGPNWWIFVAYSDDDGVTWTEEVVTTAAEMNTRGLPSIAADSLGNIHIVYTNALSEISYRRRIPAGWEAAEQVDGGGANMQGPVIAIDSQDNSHVCYTINVAAGIRYRQKTAAGVWQAIESVVGANQLYPDMVVDLNNVVHVVWVGSGNPGQTFAARREIVYRQRVSGTWATQELISDVNGHQDFPTLTVSSDGNVHVVWHGPKWGANPANQNIRYRERTAAGVWQAHTAITDIAAAQGWATIGLDSADDLFVFWRGTGWGANPANTNIQQMKRESGVWQAQVNITDRAFDQDYPSPMSSFFPRTERGTRSFNIPGTGYIIHFQGNGAGTIRSEVFLSADLVFSPALATVITVAATQIRLQEY